MTTVGETVTYLEGRIAALETTCAILLRATFNVNKKGLDIALFQTIDLLSSDAQPGFKRGYEEGVDQTRQRIGKTEFILDILDTTTSLR